MRIFHLAVDEWIPPGVEMAGEMDESDLGGVVDAAEHGFTEEDASYGHTVESADQSIFETYLNGMGVTGRVKLHVGLDHFRCDPGAVGTLAGCGAGLDDGFEVTVEVDFESPMAQGLAQTAGDAQVFRKQDAAGIGRPPEYGLSRLIPGKDPGTVGQEQALRAEIAASCQQPVGVAQRPGDGGEAEYGVRRVDPVDTLHGDAGSGEVNQVPEVGADSSRKGERAASSSH